MKKSEGLGLSTLVEKIQQAVLLKNSHAITQGVKEALEELILSQAISLPGEYQKTQKDRYSRRLLHEDNKNGFVIVAMTWGPGQRTGLHDHSGVWCVEGVLQGEMLVEQYKPMETKNGAIRFVHQGEIKAGVGNSGALIPPYEHHVLSNALKDKVSITIHVYESNITRCTVYTPVGGEWFKEEECKLEYQL